MVDISVELSATLYHWMTILVLTSSVQLSTRQELKGTSTLPALCANCGLVEGLFDIPFWRCCTTVFNHERMPMVRQLIDSFVRCRPMTSKAHRQVARNPKDAGKENKVRNEDENLCPRNVGMRTLWRRSRSKPLQCNMTPPLCVS